jgi:hypothetical protein
MWILFCCCLIINDIYVKLNGVQCKVVQGQDTACCPSKHNFFINLKLTLFVLTSKMLAKFFHACNWIKIYVKKKNFAPFHHWRNLMPQRIFYRNTEDSFPFPRELYWLQDEIQFHIINHQFCKTFSYTTKEKGKFKFSNTLTLSQRSL